MAKLSLIFAIALLLRFLMLSRESLWLDEIASWSIAGQNLTSVLSGEPTNPPLYYMALHYWMGWFGSTEFALRSLSILPSALSVWLVYKVSKKLFNIEIGLISGSYQALSTFQIYYAQEARCFSLLVAILLAATLCLWNALEAHLAKTRIIYLSAYSILGALALYTHFIAVFFLAGHGLYVLCCRPQKTLIAGISIGGSLLLFLPWLTIMLHAAAAGGQHRRYLLLKLPQAYFTFLFGYSLIPMDEKAVQHIPETLRSSWWLLILSLLSVGILTPFLRRAWKRWGESLRFVAILAGAPVLLAFAISFKVMLFSERYLIPASPFVYMMVAAAMWEIWISTSNRDTRLFKPYLGWMACGAYCLLLVLSLLNYYFNSRFGKDQWREADAYIDSLVPVGETGIIVFDPDFIHNCYSYYTTRNLPAWPLTAKIKTELTSSVKIVKDHTQGFQRILLVRCFDTQDAVLSIMKSQFTLQSYRRFDKANSIEVYSFEAK